MSTTRTPRRRLGVRDVAIGGWYRTTGGHFRPVTFHRHATTDRRGRRHWFSSWEGVFVPESGAAVNRVGVRISELRPA